MSTSTNKALDIIELLSQRPRGPRELSEALDVHRSTVVRLLHSMEPRGFVRRAAGGSWAVGFRLVAIGQHALDDIDLRSVARPSLEVLSEELGHTLHLAALVGSDVVYVDKLDGIGAVRMKSRVGAKALVHTAGVAKAVLAFAPEATRQAAMESCDFERFTDTTITDADALSAEYAAIRERGWAVDDGEAEDFINCVAVPIFGMDGAVQGGISLTAVRSLAPLEVLTGYVEKLQTVADRISRELGAAPRSPARTD
ncbi:IclR family transcriptional regulator [Microbacterium aquimaris]|uniref:IclR family transcriptional regulator n=1 Tax=Microbacterium aquimaris TaxID=459816 RepID=UPI002AD2D83D|nr:IclR family transcriptional regulator [Microbacterium aquimaris]MDZ8275275.1 IclR family transcriptional regulator [Microbacterium aquimaris]